MSGRPGFFGGLRGDQPDRDADPGEPGFGDQGIRLGDPNGSANNPFAAAPGFDPVWGSLGAPVPGRDDWLSQTGEEGPTGEAVDVEIFGDGFQISGQIRSGQFGRLSDWINMQSGFIQVQDAWHVHLGQRNLPDPDQQRGTLWVRLDQIVLVAERALAQQVRPGAPVVQKQRRKVSIVTPGYSLRGSLHIHTYGSMKQLLETPDPHFLPLTELNVRWLSDSNLVARYPFAMVNRAQLVTILDESSAPAGDTSLGRPDSAGEMPLHHRSGAA
jgi:hypothetical protein